MAAKQLTGDDNLPDELVDILFENANPTEMRKLALSFLDNTLNHPNIGEKLRAQMVAEICWEWGLNPPDKIKEWLT